MSQTLKKDGITKPVDALLEIYRKMRPGDPPTVPTAYRLLEGMFFDTRKFDFSRVGRLKFNIKMGKPERDRMEDPVLSAKDFVEVVSYLLKMRKNPAEYSRPTTSTTWATAASARWASCWKINSASAWKEWNAPSRKKCQSSRICIPRCRAI